MFNESFKIREREGSALLISLLLMSFLIVFGIGVGSLIIDSVRVERNVVSAGKAYFAGEAAIELSLYEQENQFPGYSTGDDGEVIYLSNGSKVEYKIVGAEPEVPCAHRDSDVIFLSQQESVSLPLFRASTEEEQDDTGSPSHDLEFFTLDYSLDRMDDVSANVALRWKVLGLDELGGYTEAVSGILSYDGTNGFDQLTSDDTGVFYDQGSAPYTSDLTHPISTFLEGHSLNYLVLTNVFSWPVDPAEGMSNDLLVKLAAENPAGTEVDTSTCEYTLIEADGISGRTLQSIDVQVKLDTFLPVFDFVLYQTETG